MCRQKTISQNFLQKASTVMAKEYSLLTIKSLEENLGNREIYHDKLAHEVTQAEKSHCLQTGS